MAFLGPNVFNFHTNKNVKKMVDEGWCCNNFVLWKYLDKKQRQWADSKGKYIVYASMAKSECNMRNVAAFTQLMLQYLEDLLQHVKCELHKLVMSRFNNLGYQKNRRCRLSPWTMQSSPGLCLSKSSGLACIQKT